MPVGRLFYEIAGDTSRLQQSIRDAVSAAQDAGVKITRAGQSFIATFDDVRSRLLSIENPADRAQEANKLLGGRLRELIPLLLNSKTSLTEFASELEKTGIVTDDVTQERLMAADAELDKLVHRKNKLPANSDSSGPRSSSASDKYALCQLQPAVCRDSPLGTTTGHFAATLRCCNWDSGRASGTLLLRHVAA